MGCFQNIFLPLPKNWRAAKNDWMIWWWWG